MYKGDSARFSEVASVTRHPLVFRELTGSQRTPGFWGVTNNNVVRLIGFPGGQLVQPRSDNLLFGDMWKALLSLHAAKLDPK